MTTHLASEHRADLAHPASTPHEHGWVTESAHRTSDGVVRYVRCAECRLRRVDLQASAAEPPVALSDARG
ncbi:hypothetical protein ACFXQA_06840 [Microbacterium sp. P07]|uniref:hypothetical protein n=1 Tax=Microbacterium sp. P07 TaxID=3366952 RepID=UPI0037469907